MSRYPVHGRPAGGYDESLLQIAPQITRADRQQGYSVDILEQGGRSNYQYGPNAPRRQPIAQGYEQNRFQHRQQPSYSYDQSAPPALEKADYYSSSTLDQRDIFTVNPYKPKKPWYRTTRGIVILLVVLLVLAGAAVGIALGVRSATNKANADRNGAQRGATSGNGGSSVGPSSGANRAGGGATTDSLPALPSLNLVTLGNAQQPAVATVSDISLRLNPIPAATAVATAIQTRPAATTPAQATSVTLANVAPTTTRAASVTPTSAGPAPSVDPVCARFPSLPSCKQG